jgi:hypothetical protein
MTYPFRFFAVSNPETVSSEQWAVSSGRWAVGGRQKAENRESKVQCPRHTTNDQRHIVSRRRCSSAAIAVGSRRGSNLTGSPKTTDTMPGGAKYCWRR